MNMGAEDNINILSPCRFVQFLISKNEEHNYYLNDKNTTNNSRNLQIQNWQMLNERKQWLLSMRIVHRSGSF